MASTFHATEGTFSALDGFHLYTKTWKPTVPVVAHLVFIHGFSDHCNAYYNFFPSLASKGIQVHSFDQRGWGRSVHKNSEKGLTGPTATVMSDIAAFIHHVIKETAEDGLPLFLMGHSMGGQEVLYFAATGPKDLLCKIRGFLLESPYVDTAPATRPSKLLVFVGRIAGKLLPHMQKVQKIDAKFLSHDPVVQKSFLEDKLCHDTGTLQGLADMLDRSDALNTGRVRVKEGENEGGKTRIWLSHGTGDQVTDPVATEKLYKEHLEVEDKELKIYDGWYHKLHAEIEPDATQYAEDVAAWILARLEPVGDVRPESRRSKL